MARYILYLLRWQLSTPILWVVIDQLGQGIPETIIANLIGGLIFFWIDKLIFKRKEGLLSLQPIGEIKISQFLLKEAIIKP